MLGHFIYKSCIQQKVVLYTHTYTCFAALKRFGQIRRPAYNLSQVCLQQNGLQCQVHGGAMAFNAKT